MIARVRGSDGATVSFEGGGFPADGAGPWLLSAFDDAGSASAGFNAFMDAAPLRGSRGILGVAAILDGWLRVHPAFVALGRTSSARTQAELSGAWRVHGVVVPDTQAGSGGALEGTLSVDADGGAQGQIAGPDHTALVTGGSLLVAPDGGLTGSLTSVDRQVVARTLSSPARPAPPPTRAAAQCPRGG